MTPEEIVKKAEAAYAAQNIEAIADLFDPEAIFYLNGKKLVEGRDQILDLERESIAACTNFAIKKTLRAASGDTIAVEWESSFLDKKSGKLMTNRGGEFWKMRNDRLVEWRAYSTGDE